MYIYIRDGGAPFKPAGGDLLPPTRPPPKIRDDLLNPAWLSIAVPGVGVAHKYIFFLIASLYLHQTRLLFTGTLHSRALYSLDDLLNPAWLSIAVPGVGVAHSHRNL